MDDDFHLDFVGAGFCAFFIRTKITTLPEFLEKRFDSRSRTFLAFMAIIGALFIHIDISLYSGSIVFQQFFGINMYLSILIVSSMTAIYTVFGGLKAVVVTENIQTVTLLLGSTILTVIAVMADKVWSHYCHCQVNQTTWNSPKSVIRGPVKSIFDIRILAGSLLVLMVVLYYIWLKLESGCQRTFKTFS